MVRHNQVNTLQQVVVEQEQLEMERELVMEWVASVEVDGVDPILQHRILHSPLQEVEPMENQTPDLVVEVVI
jgi:hypothetical protein